MLNKNLDKLIEQLEKAREIAHLGEKIKLIEDSIILFLWDENMLERRFIFNTGMETHQQFENLRHELSPKKEN